MSILMLIWVLVAGQSTNGASRWISFAGIQFQPSELGKGALVLAIAQILSAMQTEHGADRKAFKYNHVAYLWYYSPRFLVRIFPQLCSLV